MTINYNRSQAFATFVAVEKALMGRPAVHVEKALMCRPAVHVYTNALSAFCTLCVDPVFFLYCSRFGLLLQLEQYHLFFLRSFSIISTFLKTPVKVL